MQEENRPKFVIETERIYKSFETEINLIRQCAPSKKTDIQLKDVIVSAYVKAYDFVLYICRLNDFKDAFFQIPMLRGICEDLITITYLLKQSEGKQNYLLVLKRFEELKKSTNAQYIFFNKYNVGQVLPPSINQVDIELILEEYRKAGHLLEETKFPTVFKMAKSVNLEDLYSFIYHATSKSVHFDIFTLLSMGWGEIDTNNGTIKPNFSYQHDYHHYYTFSLFYSSYLFLQQTKNFNNYLILSQKISDALIEIETGYENIDWPELVTFKQMNIKPPSPLMRSMYRIIQKNELEE